VKGGGLKTIFFSIIGFTIATSVYADVIYDDQNYYDNTWFDGYSIYGDDGYETADDFETTADWNLEVIRFWDLWGHSFDIRVDIFDDSGAGPGTNIFREEVSSTEMTWTDMHDPFYAIWEVDIPISGFNIASGTRYWLGLQSTSSSFSCYWLVTENDPAWWSNCYFYDGGWYDSVDYFGYASACMFELHGSPADAAVEPASLGTIKAGFAE
jgi:hypothetical protein